MAFTTVEGTRYLSLGEFTTLAKNLDGSSVGIQQIYEGAPITNKQAQVVLLGAVVNANDQANAIINTALMRLEAA